MPRPQRLRDKERQTAAEAPDAPDPEDNEGGAQVETQAADTATLDDADKNAQSSERSGPVEDDDPFIVSLAQRLGHTPKDQWKRDPAKWQPARQFLESTPQVVESLNERLRRIGQVAEDQAEEARQRGVQEGETRLRAAIEAGNADDAVAASRQIAQHSGPPPQTVAWMARNPWFNEDRRAQAQAVAAINQAAAEKLSIEEQLAAGEEVVRRLYPQHFGPTNGHSAPSGEARLSDVRPAPVVHGGSRSNGGGAVREKGWADIPAQGRKEMQRFVNKWTREHNMTEAQAQAKIATSYWRTQA